MKYILFAILPALSCIAAPQKAAPPYEAQLSAFHECAGQMSRVLYAANTALAAVTDRPSADAAAPLVQEVHAAHTRMTTAARELEQAGATVTELYGKGKLRQSLRHLPIGHYNELRDELLSKKCHGSVRLYLALTDSCSQFNEAQIAAPPNEAQSATLQTVAELFELLRRNTNMREWNTEADFDSKLLDLIDKAQPGIDELQQNPTALMQFDALVIAARPSLQLLYERNFYELGDPEERLMRRPDNFFAALYSDYYRHNATAPSTSSTQN